MFVWTSLELKDQILFDALFSICGCLLLYLTMGVGGFLDMLSCKQITI